jgi:hypothetical protein
LGELLDDAEHNNPGSRESNRLARIMTGFNLLTFARFACFAGGTLQGFGDLPDRKFPGCPTENIRIDWREFPENKTFPPNRAPVSFVAPARQSFQHYSCRFSMTKIFGAPPQN